MEMAIRTAISTSSLNQQEKLAAVNLFSGDNRPRMATAFNAITDSDLQVIWVKAEIQDML